VKVRLKPNLLIVSGETPEEIRELAEWAGRHDEHAFWLTFQDEQTFRMIDLGPKPDACREPINILSTSSDPEIRILSNFAETPFELDGRTYASVEGFWQGLKFEDETKRREIAALVGPRAKQAGEEAGPFETLVYEGHTIRSGSPEHWGLMALACGAKFSQHAEARQALLKTGDRPLVHKPHRDSRTIPGVIMADIWMRVREGLHKQLEATP
jgi:predicted NAD-dependent protein-ADP-ribosyltransferase YbiA (DUF1768 family)